MIVDEFQDLTPGEQELFLKLKKRGWNLHGIGRSERQSIYAFRGNDRKGSEVILMASLPSFNTAVKDIDHDRVPALS